MAISRRKLIAGAAGTAVLGAAVLEWEKLQGRFDHYKKVRPTAADAWAASLKEIEAAGASDGAVVHVGQSTHFLMVGGKRMLTDPWFHDPAFGALTHESGPAVAPQDVGPLDYLLVTHDHPDHADPRAMDRLDKRATAIVATTELVARLKKMGFAAVELLEPWKAFTAGPITVSAVPAVHDIYEIGFVIEGAGHRVYFAGDTRLHDDLPAIAERFTPTAAILPVDGTRLIGGEKWVMTPDDAVEAATILKVQTAMPSHADAVFSDPLVAAGLATTIAGANGLFAAKMKSSLPGVRCENPSPGSWFRL